MAELKEKKSENSYLSLFREKDADFDFYYDFLDELTKEKLMLYGVPTEITENFFGKRVYNALINDKKLQMKIRRILKADADLTKFIKSFLIPQTKHYISDCDEAFIEKEFDKQIESAASDFNIFDMVKKFEELSLEADTFIRDNLPKPSTQQKDALEGSHKKWDALIKKTYGNISTPEALTLTSMRNYIFLILAIPVLYFNHTYLFPYIRHIFKNEEHAYAHDTLIKKDDGNADYAIQSAILLVVVCTIIFTIFQKSFRWIYPKKPITNLISIAANGYLGIYLDQREKAQLRADHLLSQIPPRKNPVVPPPCITSESTLEPPNDKPKVKRRDLPTEESSEQKKNLAAGETKRSAEKEKVEIIVGEDKQYVRLYSRNGLFKTPKLFEFPLNLEGLNQRCFTLIKEDPVKYAENTLGKSCFKSLSPAEKKGEWKGYSGKCKFLGDGTRIPVKKRTPTEAEEKNIGGETGCKKIYRIVEKKAGAFSK